MNNCLFITRKLSWIAFPLLRQRATHRWPTLALARSASAYPATGPRDGYCKLALARLPVLSIFDDGTCCWVSHVPQGAFDLVVLSLPSIADAPVAYIQRTDHETAAIS